MPCWFWFGQWLDPRSTSLIWRWCPSIPLWTTRPALFSVLLFMLGLMLSKERERNVEKTLNDTRFFCSLQYFIFVLILLFVAALYWTRYQEFTGEIILFCGCLWHVIVGLFLEVAKLNVLNISPSHLVTVDSLSHIHSAYKRTRTRCKQCDWSNALSLEGSETALHCHI